MMRVKRERHEMLMDVESGANSESSDDADEVDAAELREGLGPEPPRQERGVELVDEAETEDEDGEEAEEEEKETRESCGKRFYNACYPLSGSSGGRSGTPRLEALDGPRWIAAIHIVLYHFYNQKGEWTEGWNKDLTDWLQQLFGWGSSWLNFFFILSGFLLAYTEMARPPRKGQKLSILQYIRKRLIVLYPVYLLSLIFVALTKQNINRFEWAVLPLHLGLMQAWLPICSSEAPYQCSAWSWNGEAWFLSVLVVYWLTLRPLTAKVRYMTLRQCYAILLGCFLWSFVFLLDPKKVFEASPSAQQRLQILIRASPLGYFQVFVAGVVAARVFMLTSIIDAETEGPITESTKKISLDGSEAPCVFKYGCCIGYAIFLIFGASFGEPPVMDNGGMIPVMLLIVMGAATGVDPLAVWIFRSKPLIVLGQLSYVQYILQRTVYDFMILHFDNHVVYWSYPFVLIAFAYFVQRWYETPYVQWQLMLMDKGEDAWGRWIQQIDNRAESTQRRRVIVNCFLLFLLFGGILLVVFA